MINLPTPFRLAIKESELSRMRPKVGAVIVSRKYSFGGHNKQKTHTVYANPEIHERISIHAELDCLNRMPIENAEEIYVYRELDGLPAMARPCNHCMSFLIKAGIRKVYYTIPHDPYWEMERL